MNNLVPPGRCTGSNVGEGSTPVRRAASTLSKVHPARTPISRYPIPHRAVDESIDSPGGDPLGLIDRVRHQTTRPIRMEAIMERRAQVSVTGVRPGGRGEPYNLAVAPPYALRRLTGLHVQTLSRANQPRWGSHSVVRGAPFVDASNMRNLAGGLCDPGQVTDLPCHHLDQFRVFLRWQAAGRMQVGPGLGVCEYGAVDHAGDKRYDLAVAESSWKRLLGLFGLLPGPTAGSGERLVGPQPAASASDSARGQLVLEPIRQELNAPGPSPRYASPGDQVSCDRSTV